MALSLRWMWTNTWAVLTALALHSAIGKLAGLDQEQARGYVLETILSMVIGAPIIGGIVGWAQGRVLARRIGSLSRRRWVGLTVAGAALVLGAGAMAARVGLTVHFATFEGDGAPATLERTWTAVFFTQITGFLIGLLLGGPQSWALPAPANLRIAWVVANGAGWSLGMLLTALCIGFLNPEADLQLIFAALFAGLALTGASVGLFTSLVLTRLITP